MLLPFSKIWVVDFEYVSTPGNLPEPICLVAKEINTGETIKVWLEGNNLKAPPYDINESSLFWCISGAVRNGYVITRLVGNYRKR